ncbi:Protein of unknown function [Gryllus bimaculatus]|nr:Protein of unknown function [Gryllus bimaculatus]
MTSIIGSILAQTLVSQCLRSDNYLYVLITINVPQFSLASQCFKKMS